MTDRIKVKVAVFLVLEREGKYLFSQRKNTGYRDGFYTVPAGHVDPGELPTIALVRESAEEIGIVLEKEDLEFVHVMFQEDVYSNFYFRARKWKGEPCNKEPEKCEEIRWASISELGDLVAPKVADALRDIENGILYSERDAEI